MSEYVIIQLKDLCYYGDDFKYAPFIVKRDDNFEEKFVELQKICKNYEDFGEVEDFIADNFTKVEFETREILV